MLVPPLRKLFAGNLAVTLILATLGIMVGLSIPMISDWSLYRLIFVSFAGLFMPVAIAATGNLARACLFGVIFAIPLNLILTPFGDAPSHAGGAPAIVQIYLYDLPLVGLVGVWVWQVFTQKKAVPRSAVILTAFLWILWSALSIHNSQNLKLSWFEILRMVKLSVLMLATATLVREKRDIRVVFSAFLLSLILQSLVCVIEYATGSFFQLFDRVVIYHGEFTRVTGTMNQSNTTGAFLAALSTMALVLFICKTDGKLNALSLVAAFAGFVALILTYSRGAWASFLVALAFGMFIARAKHWLDSAAIARLAMAILVIAACALLFFPDIVRRLNETSLLQAEITSRVSLMKTAESMILAHPILGVGINTFVEVMQSYDSTGISYVFAYPVHIVYLLIAAETGVAGLGLFVLFVVSIFQESARALGNSRRVIASSALSVMTGVTAILVSNLADVHLKGETMFALFWLLAGLSIALRQMQDSSVLISTPE